MPSASRSRSPGSKATFNRQHPRDRLGRFTKSRSRSTGRSRSRSRSPGGTPRRRRRTTRRRSRARRTNPMIDTMSFSWNPFSSKSDSQKVMDLDNKIAKLQMKKDALAARASTYM